MDVRCECGPPVLEYAVLFVIGFVTTAVLGRRPQGFMSCFGWSTTAVALLLAGLGLSVLKEHMMYIAVLPFVLACVAAGTWVAWALFHRVPA